MSFLYFNFLRLLRAQFFWVLLIALLVLCCSGFLAAQFSGRQPATVALDVGVSLMRLMVPLLVALVAQDLIGREFDRRLYLTSLAYPVSRVKWLLSRYFTVLAVVLFVVLVSAFLLWLVVYVVSLGYGQSTPVAMGLEFVVVVIFMLVDFFVISTVAVMVAVVAVTPGFVLVGVLGFTLVARSYVNVLVLLAGNGWVVEDADRYRAGIGGLAYFLPDLGGLDVRSIALYGDFSLMPNDWSLLLLSNIGYAIAVLALSAHFMNSKKFN